MAGVEHWRSELGGIRPIQLDLEHMFEETHEEEDGLDSSLHSLLGLPEKLGLPLNASKLIFERTQSSRGTKSRSRSPSPRSDTSSRNCSRSPSPIGRRLSAVGMDTPVVGAVNPVGRNGMRNCAVWAVGLAAFTSAAMKAPKLTRSVEVDCTSLLRQNHISLNEMSQPLCTQLPQDIQDNVARLVFEDNINDFHGEHLDDEECMRLRGGLHRANSPGTLSQTLRGGSLCTVGCEGCAKAGFEGRRGFELLRDSTSEKNRPIRPKLSRTVDLH